MYNNPEYDDVKEKVLQDLYGKNWIATFCLLLAFGFFGAHRFYTGKTGSAVAMLLCTICFIGMPITMIWCVIDFFAITLGKFKAADGSDLYEPYYWIGYAYIIIFLFFFVMGFLGHAMK